MYSFLLAGIEGLVVACAEADARSSVEHSTGVAAVGHEHVGGGDETAHRSRAALVFSARYLYTTPLINNAIYL